MSDPSAHVLSWWPILVAGATGVVATAIAVRYKIPELVKKVETMETKNPSKDDLKKTVENIHTVCKFNQVSCQKALDSKISKVKDDLDNKLSELYELVNTQAILMARVDERVQAMHENVKSEAPACENGKHCILGPQGAMLTQNRS